MELNNQADPQVSIVQSPDAGVVAGACDSQLPNLQASHLEVEASPRPRSGLLPLLRKELPHEEPGKKTKNIISSVYQRNLKAVCVCVCVCFIST